MRVAVDKLLRHADQRVEDLRAQSVNHPTGNNVHKVVAKEIAACADHRQHNCRNRHGNPRIFNGTHIPRRPEPVRRIGYKAHTDLGRLAQRIQ